MKRKLAVAMAAALVLTTALAGCGNKTEDTKSEGTKNRGYQDRRFRKRR